MTTITGMTITATTTTVTAMIMAMATVVATAEGDREIDGALEVLLLVPRVREFLVHVLLLVLLETATADFSRGAYGLATIVVR